LEQATLEAPATSVAMVLLMPGIDAARAFETDLTTSKAVNGAGPGRGGPLSPAAIGEGSSAAMIISVSSNARQAASCLKWMWLMPTPSAT